MEKERRRDFYNHTPYLNFLYVMKTPHSFSVLGGGNRDTTLLCGNALQTSLPAFSSSHMLIAKIAD